MNSKFKYGDKVMAGNHPGTIVSIKQDGPYFVCTVKFDNDRLIPPQMDYNEMYLGYVAEDEEVCPICKTRWTISKFNMHVWKDCKKCKKTQEDCVKQSKINKKIDNRSDLLKDFEKMLNEESDDDDKDNDFFMYGF